MEGLNYLLSIDDKKPDYYFLRCYCYRFLGKYEKALQDIDKCIQLGDATSSIYTEKGTVLYELERYLESRAALNKAIYLDPNSYDAYKYIGYVHYNLGEFENAIDDLMKAVNYCSEEKDCSRVYFNIGYIYSELDKHQEAIDAYSKSIDIEFYDQAYLRRALEYNKIGEYEKAWRDCTMLDDLGYVKKDDDLTDKIESHLEDIKME